MIKPGARPAVRVVALRAIGGQSGSLVIQRGGTVEIRQVAAGAACVQASKHCLRGPSMAGLALHGGMRSREWKPVLVILKCPHRGCPSLDRVTGFTAVSELCPVDVGVAIGAGASNIAEVQLHVASRTSYSGVHASQGKTRGAVVIEFRRGSNWLPTDGGMAVFTGNTQIAVRVHGPHRCIRLRVQTSGGYPENCEQQSPGGCFVQQFQDSEGTVDGSCSHSALISLLRWRISR